MKWQFYYFTLTSWRDGPEETTQKVAGVNLVFSAVKIFFAELWCRVVLWYAFGQPCVSQEEFLQVFVGFKSSCMANGLNFEHVCPEYACSCQMSDGVCPTANVILSRCHYADMFLNLKICQRIWGATCCSTVFRSRLCPEPHETSTRSGTGVTLPSSPRDFVVVSRFHVNIYLEQNGCLPSVTLWRISAAELQRESRVPSSNGVTVLCPKCLRKIG